MPLLANILSYFVPSGIPKHLTSWVPGQSIFSTNASVATAIITYFAVIFGLQALLRDQKPFKLTGPFQIHNLLLTTGSALLLALFLEEIGPIVWKHGLWAGVCHDRTWTPRAELYYMINYYFKYWELADTVFLVLKKKPLPFLHVFHHSATAVLCYTQLEGRTNTSWPIIFLNLSVHVIMYYYYYATAGGAKFWWKKYLTSMQIVQFITDLCIMFPATYANIAHKHFPSLPQLGECTGGTKAMLFCTALITSYLGLFINFYIQTYKAAAKQNGKANGTTSKIAQ